MPHTLGSVSPSGVNSSSGVPACHRDNGDTRGRSNSPVRGEIRRSCEGELRRRQLSRLPPPFKGESVGSKDDQIPL